MTSCRYNNVLRPNLEHCKNNLEIDKVLEDENYYGQNREKWIQIQPKSDSRNDLTTEVWSKSSKMRKLMVNPK
jgi:hypothetical protein